MFLSIPVGDRGARHSERAITRLSGRAVFVALLSLAALVRAWADRGDVDVPACDLERDLSWELSLA